MTVRILQDVTLGGSRFKRGTVVHVTPDVGSALLGFQSAEPVSFTRAERDVERVIRSLPPVDRLGRMRRGDHAI